MALVTQHFDLQIIPNTAPPVLDVSQYDTARSFVAHLKDVDGSPYILPNGATALLDGKNQNGLVFRLNVSINNDTLTFMPDDILTDTFGRTYATLTITSAEQIISPLGIIFNIQRAGISKEEQTSNPEFREGVTAAFEAYLQEHGTPSSGEMNVQSNWNQGNSNASDFIRNKPTMLSQFQNDSSFVSLYEILNKILPIYYAPKQDEIVRTAMSYYINRNDGSGNPRFQYNQHDTYRKEHFHLGNIDCSALVGLIIRGIDYDNSPYGMAYADGAQIGEWVGTKNNGDIEHQAQRTDGTGALIPWDKDEDPVFNPDSVVCNKDMSWAVNPRDYWCLGNYKTVDSEGDPGDTDSDEGLDVSTPYSGRPLSAANLAQLLMNIGYVIPITEDFSMIQPGDILFWSKKADDGSYIRPKRFLYISHTAVVVEVDENGQHFYVDSMSSKPPDFILDNTIRKACLETDPPSAEFLTLVIRLPQGRTWERLRIIYNPEDKDVMTGESQRFTCIAAGDIVHYQWQYSDSDPALDTDDDPDTNMKWVNSTLPKIASINVTTNANMGRQVTEVDEDTHEEVTYRERRYHCICTDTHGRSLTSRDAILRIYPNTSDDVTDTSEV